ncbi:hypothetical protein [Roseibium album]|uniref:hypothetical protein n=1 Tax=Roseibium album TaxID=311410 RepID=UPI0039191F23
MDHLKEQLEQMADGNGEIAYTTNTESLLDEAEKCGLVTPVFGKIKMVEPNTLNSIYRLTN